MEKVYDKLILFICCGCFLLHYDVSLYALLSAVVVIGMNLTELVLNKESVNIFFYAFYVALSIQFPVFCFFLPLMSYEILCEHYSALILLGLFPVGQEILTNPAYMLFTLPLLTLTAYLLKKRMLHLTSTKKEYGKLRDNMFLATQGLKLKNQDLLEKQDYEVNNATLNERNRIAREIHDTVGHLLSSSLLQVGALLAVCQNPALKEGLLVLKETLSQGMDSIRASVHNLHEDSMDLEHKLKDLIQKFTFCPVELYYQIEHDFSMKAKYSILYIVKEALGNVMKHSNADKVCIIIEETEQNYRMHIEDNGTKKENRSGDRKADSSGIGVHSMVERVQALNGHFHTDTRDGFHIHVTLPISLKEKCSEENGGA